MNISNDSPIDGVSVVYPDATDVVVITESGKINKFSIGGLQRSSRYKAGSSVIKLGKTDKIHSMFGVNDKNVLRIITKNEKMEIPVSEITRGSSLSAGTSYVKRSDMIVKCSILKGTE